EEGSDPDSPAPKPAKATKPKATKQSMPSVYKAPSEPKLAPAKPQEKNKDCYLRLVDEFVDKGVPENEPGFDDKEANLQRAVEESLNDVHFTHRDPLPPVVFREPDSGRRQSFPETTTKTKAESMMSVTIQQDTSIFPSMTTPVIDLTSRPDSPNAHQPLPATATETITTTTTTRPLPSQPQQSTIDSILIKRIARRKKKKRHDSPKTPPGFPPLQPPLPPPSTGPYETSGSSGDFGSSQVAPRPPPPLSTNQKGQTHGFIAPSSSKTAASAEYTAWPTSDIRFKSSLSSIPEDLHMDDDSDLDEQVHSYDDEDIRNDHILKVNLMQDWWKPLFKEDRPATPEPAWSIPSSDLPIPMNN
nr:hypothetical protein [Tanacetum cinerariifolium]